MKAWEIDQQMQPPILSEHPYGERTPEQMTASKLTTLLLILLLFALTIETGTRVTQAIRSSFPEAPPASYSKAVLSHFADFRGQ